MSRGALLYRCVIPGKPVTKKNSQQILVNKKTGMPFVAPSKAYKDWETMAGYRLGRKPSEPLQSRVEVVCLFYRQTLRAIDLPNALNAADDMLVHYGILADDNCNIIVSHDGSRVLYDKEQPRTEIEIYEYKE